MRRGTDLTKGNKGFVMPIRKSRDDLDKQEIIDVLKANAELFKHEEDFAGYIAELAIYLLDQHYRQFIEMKETALALNDKEQFLKAQSAPPTPPGEGRDKPSSSEEATEKPTALDTFNAVLNSAIIANTLKPVGAKASPKDEAPSPQPAAEAKTPSDPKEFINRKLPRELTDTFLDDFSKQYKLLRKLSQTQEVKVRERKICPHCGLVAFNTTKCPNCATLLT